MSPALLFVSGEYPPDIGGVGDYTARLRAALDVGGWRSRVLSRRQVGRWDARSLLRVALAAPRRGVVHIQYQAAAFDLLGDACLLPAVLHALHRDVKVATTFHDIRVPYLFPAAGNLRPRAIQLLASHSDAVVAAAGDDLRRLGGPSPRHHHVPIGPNVACLPPSGYERAAFRRALGLAPETLAIVYFGLFNASKGLNLLLDTFDLVRRATPDARLLLLGGEVGASDPTDRRTAARLTARLVTLGNRVRRTGWLDPGTLSAHLLAADLAVLPYVDGASARRGSLLACAEHGLPIVSTLPAAPEVASAIHATPPEAGALADAVLHIASNPAVRERLRASARALAMQMSWPRIAAAHVAIYEQLLYS